MENVLEKGMLNTVATEAIICHANKNCTHDVIPTDYDGIFSWVGDVLEPPMVREQNESTSFFPSILFKHVSNSWSPSYFYGLCLRSKCNLHLAMYSCKQRLGSLWWHKGSGKLFLKFMPFWTSSSQVPCFASVGLWNRESCWLCNNATTIHQRLCHDLCCRLHENWRWSTNMRGRWLVDRNLSNLQWYAHRILFLFII